MADTLPQIRIRSDMQSREAAPTSRGDVTIRGLPKESASRKGDQRTATSDYSEGILAAPAVKQMGVPHYSLTLQHAHCQLAKTTNLDSYLHFPAVSQMLHLDQAKPRKGEICKPLILYLMYVQLHMSHTSWRLTISDQHIMKRTNTQTMLPPKIRTGAPSEEETALPETGVAVAPERTSSDLLGEKSENVMPGVKDKRWIFLIRPC